MKIRFTANSSLQHEFPNIQYGFTHYAKISKTSKDSFGIKVFEKLDQYFNSYQSLTAQDGDIIRCLYDTVEYVEKESNLKLVDNFGIHLNTTTRLNDNYSKIFSTIMPFSKISELFSEKEEAYLSEQQMVIGIGQFNNKSNKFSPLYKDIGALDLSQLIFFHELGHSLEISNSLEKTNYSSSIQKLFENADIYGKSFSENVCNESNKQLRKITQSPEFSLLNHEFVSALSSLKGEMYADVSCLLLKRNFDIQKNKFTPHKFNNYTKALSNFRENDFQPKLKNLDFGFSRLSFEYHTSPALRGLLDNPLLQTNKLLTQQEIHTICQQQVQLGVSQILYTMMSVDNSVKPQLYHLMNIKEIATNQKNNYDSTLFSELEKQVGQKWLTNFKPLEKLDNYQEYKTPGDKNIAVFSKNLLQQYEIQKSYIINSELITKKSHRYSFPKEIRKIGQP